jgi:Trk-type K+ transport system membrane component
MIENANISLSGNFKTLSKLVMMVVMLRGRHRGLPLAVSLNMLELLG